MAREAAGANRQVRRAQERRKPPTRRASRFGRFAAPLLVAAGLFAYHNSLNGPFVLDDVNAIPKNETIRKLWPLSAVLSPPTGTAVTGRPLVNLSLAFNYAADGSNVASYHVFNLAIHLLAALILFGIIGRTLGDRRAGAPDRDEAKGLAAAVALLWVVHPLTSESVDYTIQRTELLMGLFFLLTLYCAIRGFESPERRGWHAAALAAFALGLGSKEIIVVAPAVVLVYDWLFHSSSLRDAIKRHWHLYAGFAVVLVFSIFLVETNLRRAFSGFRGRTLTPWDYAMTQSGVIVHYLRLALWPHPLVADYDGWPIATSLGKALPFLVGLLALAALILWGLVRRRKLAFLGIWFFLILVPTSSFRPMPREIAAERRMYLPLIAVVVLLVLAGDALLRHRGAPRGAGVALVAVLAVTLALVTMRRNDDYRTTLSFWSDVVAKRPNNPRARMWLGEYLYRSGRSLDALAHLEEAVRLDPRNGTALYDLAVVLANQGRTDEAIERYREALRIDPEQGWAHGNLGAALARRGRIDEAIGHYREAIRILPGDANAHYNLALALAQQGRAEEAIEHLEAAVRLKPDFPEARRALDRSSASRASQ